MSALNAPYTRLQAKVAEVVGLHSTAFSMLQTKQGLKSAHLVYVIFSSDSISVLCGIMLKLELSDCAFAI